MKSTATVSTTFAATHDHHRVGLLVTLAGDQPVARPPVNVALVLDRSGSMERRAPRRRPRGRAALRVVPRRRRPARRSWPSTTRSTSSSARPPATTPRPSRRFAGIFAGGSTNLSGGWLEGHRQVGRDLVQGTNRVILLTDGQANQGIIDPAALRLLAGRRGGRQGVSTTCIGFGPEFNEDLLRGWRRAGGGHFWYVEHADQMTGSFEGEIEGLVSLAAQNLTVEVTLTHPGVAGVSLVPDIPVERTAEGVWRIRLGDLYAVQPRSSA